MKPMNVTELIEKLKEMPQGSKVVLMHNELMIHIRDVYQDVNYVYLFWDETNQEE